MAQVPETSFRLEYNGVNVTADFSPYVLEVEFNDALEGESDDASILLENTDERFNNDWKPTKRDKFKLWISSNEQEMFCGTFTTDECDFTWAPNTCKMKGLAAASNSPIRTNKNRQLEELTLRQIAQTIADENGLTLVDGNANSQITINLDRERAALSSAASTIRSAVASNDRNTYISQAPPVYISLKATAESIIAKGFPEEGTLILTSIKIASGLYYGGSLPDIATAKGIVLEFCGKLNSIVSKLTNRTYQRTQSTLENIQVGAISQIEETDIAFLYKLGYEYGIIFNVRDTDLVFVNMYDLDKAEGITKLTKAQFKPGSLNIKDTMTGTYKGVKVAYHNPEENELIENEINAGDDPDSTQFDDFSPNNDILQYRGRVENTQQAEAKAKAFLHRANSGGITGGGSVPGNTLLFSGMNFIFEDLGLLSGKYQVTKSTHRMQKSGGYETSFEFKGVDKLPPGSNGSATPGLNGTNASNVYGQALDENLVNARAGAFLKHKKK